MVDNGDSGARDQLIGEKAFAEVLRSAPAQVALFALLDLLPQQASELTRRQYWQIKEAAHELETLLDNYGARDNRTYVFFAELNASLRNLSKAAHTLIHLESRLPTYGIRLVDDAVAAAAALDALRVELRRFTQYLGGRILVLADAMRHEAERVSAAPPPSNGSRVDDGGGAEVRILLPSDLEDEDAPTTADEVTRLLTDYLKIAHEAQRIRDRRPPVEATTEEFLAFLREYLSEHHARTYEAEVHSLQSRYDTYVKPTPHHDRAELRQLRGHISLSYHLLEIVGGLMHFFERHEEGHARTKRDIAVLVPPAELLQFAVHVAMRYAADSLLSAVPTVQKQLPQFMRQHAVELALPDGVHLHARPLNLIVRIVRKHGKPVEIVVGDEAASASSLMGLILFVGRHPQRRSYSFRGDKAALDDLALLFSSGLGESGLDKLPRPLAWLNQV